MGFTILFALLVFVVGVTIALRRRRAARAAAAAAAQARARAAARRSRVPIVSSNVKGVTASQTIEPPQLSQAPKRPRISLYDDRDDTRRDEGEDERAA